MRALVIACAFAAAASPAVAEEGAIRINAAGRDFSSREAVEGLHAQIERAARQVFGHRHASGDDSHRLAGFMTHMVRRAPHGTPRSTGWRQARLVLKPRQFRLGTDSSSNRRATVRHPDIRGQRFRESFKRGPSVPTHPETWWRGCPLRRNHMVDVTVNF
jgi:UrcA family protein